MSDADIQVDRKGKPWLSIGAGIALAVASGSAVGGYFSQRAAQNDIINRLDQRDRADAARDIRDAKAEVRLDNIDTNINAMRLDVNEALRDPWTYTDTKFWGLEQAKFWSDVARMNPTLTLPGWPEPKRVRPSDDGKR